MMKNTGFVVCLLIMVLNIAAGILGLRADKAQNKVTHVDLEFVECIPASHRAYTRGLAATILVSISYAMANFLGGYVSIARDQSSIKSPNNRKLAAASLVLSWIVFATAFTLLLVATLANQNSDKSCGISHSHRHYFEIGGSMCFVHGIFSAFYCAALTA
ncbi:hypothetical protein ACFE04_020442 [Oxalis oulophora]